MPDRAALECSGSRRGELVANRYVLGNVLGIGGMGVVYAALQIALDRVVALKLPRPELAGDPHVKARFHIEALTSSRIAHRNVVRVFDYGEHAGAPYLVMEHVAGPRLGQLLAEHGALPIPLALQLVGQIASALEEAHANGVVHADVKCDNILVETVRDGSLHSRLIDWGIARFSDRDDTGDGLLVTGTPEYLAPEVALGGRPSFAADVYGVGVMLHELISGETPFADGAEVLVSKLDEPTVPLSRRCPGLPISPALDDLVLRALARDPSTRFPDAAALCRALEALAMPMRFGELVRLGAVSSSLIFCTHATTATMSVREPRATDAARELQAFAQNS